MINRQEIEGNLGSNPEVKTTATGKMVANFRLAHNKYQKDKDNTKQHAPVWINVEAWDELAEYCGKELTKGSLVNVTGRCDSEQWLTDDGQTRERHKLVAKEINKVVLTKKKDGKDEKSKQ